VLVNSKTANWLGTFLTWISPLRYINELAIRRMLVGRHKLVEEFVLDTFGFTWGVQTCSILCGAYMLLCIGTALFLMNYLAKRS